MAFDMYADDTRERFGPHEEFIFALATVDPLRYPQLSAMWSRFYADPRLSPEQCGAVVHELTELLAANGGPANQRLASVVLRVVPFFSSAFQKRSEVRCISD